MSSSNTPSAITRFGIFVLICGVTLVFVIWGILHYLEGAKHGPPVRTSGGPGATAPATTPGTTASNAAQPERTAATARLNERVSQAMAVLRDPNNPNKAAALDALKEALRGEEPTVAMAVIRQFLDSKQDATTGLKFKVGDDHELDESPTMRTFMMDQLGDISLEAKLGDAAEVARATLQSKDSADEWALAMRNLALADPDGSRSLLAAKVKELISEPGWQQGASGGYLEAFDLAAYAQDPSIIPQLSELSSSSNGTLKRAAQIALDRLSQVAPEQVASYLNANPSVLAQDPGHRADYMGRVDLSSPTQLAQAETYLARTDVDDAEKNKFIGRLALPAGFVSDTLVTSENIVQMPIMDHRLLVNNTAKTWLSSGKYPTLQTALQNAIGFTTDAADNNGGL